MNTGSIFVENLIGNAYFLKSLEGFSFDKEPLIDLPYLNRGNLENLKKRDFREVNYATASFGHGIAVSPAHILRFLNAIASDGIIHPLKIMQGVYRGESLSSYHDLTRNDRIAGGSRIFSERGSREIKHLMERVMMNGSGRNARIEGFHIGGKTGSAYVPKENARGYSDDVINTFLILFPLDNPQITILVRLDKPSAGLAMATTVPTAKRALEFLINYYNIQPDNFAELLKNQ